MPSGKENVLHDDSGMEEACGLRFRYPTNIAKCVSLTFTSYLLVGNWCLGSLPSLTSLKWIGSSLNSYGDGTAN